MAAPVAVAMHRRPCRRPLGMGTPIRRPAPAAAMHHVILSQLLGRRRRPRRRRLPPAPAERGQERRRLLLILLLGVPTKHRRLLLPLLDLVRPLLLRLFRRPPMRPPPSGRGGRGSTAEVPDLAGPAQRAPFTIRRGSANARRAGRPSLRRCLRRRPRRITISCPVHVTMHTASSQEHRLTPRRNQRPPASIWLDPAPTRRAIPCRNGCAEGSGGSSIRMVGEEATRTETIGTRAALVVAMAVAVAGPDPSLPSHQLLPPEVAI